MCAETCLSVAKETLIAAEELKIQQDTSAYTLLRFVFWSIFWGRSMANYCVQKLSIVSFCDALCNNDQAAS
jgi:hypothetical protein